MAKPPRDSRSRRFITPQMAKEYLDGMGPNRKRGLTRVRVMADDMLSGRWEDTHQGIAFDCEGRLVDGQHRLAAIVLSGCAQRFWVDEGLTRDQVRAIDAGRSRTVEDSLNIEGFSCTRTHGAVARRLLKGLATTKHRLASAPWAVREAIVLYKPAIDFAIKVSYAPEGRGQNAQILAAVACAWYTQDRVRLEEFGRCLARGIVKSNEDSAAAALYRHLYSRAHLSSGGGSRGCLDLFAIALRAIEAFLARRPLTKLQPVAENPFRYPSLDNPTPPAPAPVDRRKPKRPPPPELFA